MNKLWVILRSIGLISVLGFVWFLFNLNATAGDAKKLAESNNEVIQQLSRIAYGTDTELKLLLKLGAISKKTYIELQELPTTPTDSAGELYNEWYLVGDSVIYLIEANPDCARVTRIPIQ